MSAAKTKRVVELSPNGDGYFTIIVDGENWGRVSREQRGVHGSQYHVNNSKQRRVMIPLRDKLTKIKDSTTDLSLWGDKRWLRDIGYSGFGTADAIDKAKRDGVYKPITERLVEAIAKAIDDGHFKSPAELNAEAQAAADRIRKAAEQRATEEADELNARADEAIGPEVPKFVGKTQTLELRTRIVEAMKWARTS